MSKHDKGFCLQVFGRQAKTPCQNSCTLIEDLFLGSLDQIEEMIGEKKKETSGALVIPHVKRKRNQVG